MKKTIILLSFGSLFQLTQGFSCSRPARVRSVFKNNILKPLFASKQSGPVVESSPTIQSQVSPPLTTDVLSLSQSRLLLLVISAMYGTNFSFIKTLDDSLEPNLIALFRFSVAFMVFIPYVFKRDNKIVDIVKSGMTVGLFNSVGYFAQAIALQTAAASNTAFICSLTTLIVPILDIFFKKNNVVIVKKLLPALLAIAGVGLLELGGEYTLNKGDLIALMQPLAFGYAYWKTEASIQDFESRDQSLAFTGGMLLAVVISSFVWCTLDIGLPAIIHGVLPQTMSSIFATTNHDMRYDFPSVNLA